MCGIALNKTSSHVVSVRSGAIERARFSLSLAEYGSHAR